MTKSELITLTGNVIVKVDVLRSDFPRGSVKRNALDNHRDDLDTSQRKLVRSVIDDNTQEFQNLTASLRVVNTELGRTIDNVNKIAETLESLVKLIGVLQKIIELIPLA
jgi:hypothetical protein